MKKSKKLSDQDLFERDRLLTPEERERKKKLMKDKSKKYKDTAASVKKAFGGDDYEEKDESFLDRLKKAVGGKSAKEAATEQVARRRKLKRKN